MIRLARAAVKNEKKKNIYIYIGHTQTVGNKTRNWNMKNLHSARTEELTILSRLKIGHQSNFYLIESGAIPKMCNWCNVHITKTSLWNFLNLLQLTENNNSMICLKNPISFLPKSQGIYRKQISWTEFRTPVKHKEFRYSISFFLPLSKSPPTHTHLISIQVPFNISDICLEDFALSRAGEWRCTVVISWSVFAVTCWLHGGSYKDVYFGNVLFK